MLSSWGCKRRMKSFGEGWSPNFLRLTLCVINLLRLCSTWLLRFNKVYSRCTLVVIYLKLLMLSVSVFWVYSTAEKDKERFEFKFSTSAQAINSLKQQMKDLSVKLSASEENIKSRKLLFCLRHVFFFFHRTPLFWKWLYCCKMVYQNLSTVLLLDLSCYTLLLHLISQPCRREGTRRATTRERTERKLLPKWTV